MSIENISNELLTRIIEFVAEVPGTTIHSSQSRVWRQLRHTPLVSRRFYTIATPILHQAFIESKSDSVHLFVRALLRKEPSTLGTSIKRFTRTRSYNELDDPMQSWTDADFALAGTVLREVCPDEIATKWITALRGGDLDALTGLALFLMPNLEELTLMEYNNDFGDDDNFYVSYVLNKASLYQDEDRPSEQWSLPKLREVFLAYADTENGMYISTLAPFLKLRSVKRFIAHAVSDESFEAGETKFYTEDLELDYSCIAGSSMISFLGCFPNLKRFKIRRGHQVIGALLEEFVIENPFGDENFVDGPEISLPFGSLEEFKKLRKIVCESAMLLGDPEVTADFHMNDDDNDFDEDQIPVTEMSLVDVIPKSLKDLTLLGCGGGSELDYLRELLLRKDELELEISFIEFKFGGNEYEKEEAKALRRDCKAAGIMFVYR